MRNGQLPLTYIGSRGAPEQTPVYGAIVVGRYVSCINMLVPETDAVRGDCVDEAIQV